MIDNLGMIAGILSFSAYIVYIISIFKGSTKPSRSTWWILTLVGAIILSSSLSLDLYENIWIQAAYVIGPFILALLSLKYGSGDRFSLLDKICLCGAIGSCLLWLIFNSPLIGFIGSIVVDFIGLVPTIQKSYLRPEEEDPNAWLLETISSILNVVAISSWFTLEEKDWIYALYLLLINGSLTILLWRKRIYQKIKNAI